MTDNTAASDSRDALVVYASTHGHTAKIATRIADDLRAEGLEVDLREISQAAGLDPVGYHTVVVAASVHKAHHQEEIVRWVKAHRAALDGQATTFVSVSLSAAEDSDDARMAAQLCTFEFYEDTGWTPDRTECVAGCLQYREYDVFTRQLMRLLMKRSGHPTDASQDYDYTDWDAVDRLAGEIAQTRDRVSSP